MSIQTVGNTIYSFFNLLGFRQAMQFIFARYVTRESLVKLQVKGVPQPVLCRPTDSDIRSLLQVFGRQETRVDIHPPPRSIIDGGANVGYASISFAIQYPEAIILAIEPGPTNASLARENLRPYHNTRVIQGGIWSHDSYLAFENPQALSWAFRTREVSSPEEGAIESHTLDTYAEQFGMGQVDLIKLDIEGAEEQVFRDGAPACLAQTRVVIVEIHNPEARIAIDNALIPLGFHVSMHGEKLHYSRNSYPH